MNKVVTGIIAVGAIGFVGFTAIQIDLLDDRITRIELATNQLLADVENSIKTDSKTTDVIEKLYTKTTDLEKSIISIRNTMDATDALLFEMITKKSEDDTSFLEDKGLGEPQQSTTEVTRPPTTEKTCPSTTALKKRIKELELTINTFQYNRQLQ